MPILESGKAVELSGSSWTLANAQVQVRPRRQPLTSRTLPTSRSVAGDRCEAGAHKAPHAVVVVSNGGVLHELVMRGDA